MSDEEYKKHIEALAVKRMDKPKKLSSECMTHWREILSRQYNFDRGENRTFRSLAVNIIFEEVLAMILLKWVNVSICRLLYLHSTAPRV